MEVFFKLTGDIISDESHFILTNTFFAYKGCVQKDGFEDVMNGINSIAYFTLLKQEAMNQA